MNLTSLFGPTVILKSPTTLVEITKVTSFPLVLITAMFNIEIAWSKNTL